MKKNLKIRSVVIAVTLVVCILGIIGVPKSKQELKATWASMDRTEPKDISDADHIEIAIKGVPASQSSVLRTLIAERYSSYVLTAVNSTDYSLRMSPTELITLKRDTVERTKDTIGNRIDQLGLAEKSVQQYGASGSEYKLLVQLPGVDDPARVKELIGTAAVLELVDVKDGPFPSRDALLACTRGEMAA